MSQLSRRHFLSTALAGAAALPAAASTGRLPWKAPLPQARSGRGPMHDRIELLAEPFPLAQVRLLDSPFLEAAKVNDAYLQSLPSERLVHMFRVTAGLPSSAEPLGGWESPTTELRGHFTGHYLSSVGLRYAMTGEAGVKAQGDTIVDDLAACQKANRNGYVSAFPEEFFDRLGNDKQVWAPFYTLHKIMAGCLDMYTLAGNQQALQVAEGMAEWMAHWVKGMSDDQMQRVLRTEFGGTAESLWNLAALTGNYGYTATARRFEKTVFLDPLAAHRDQLKGLHVNTHIPQVIAAARRYELTGDPRYHEIAHYFWHEVVGERSYAPGGTSNGEGWDTDPGQLGHALSRSSQECCCGYNMLKLTRHLYTWTADPRYFDYYERTLFNSRLGTQHPGDGGKMYYFPLQTGWWKYFSSKTNSFWCCDGTGAEEFSKFGDSIYFHNARGLFVNLFIASELRWPERGLTVRQETRFPEEAATTLRITAAAPVAMQVNLRIPAWATSGGSVAVNGQKLAAFSNPGSYLTLERTWQDGDRIELQLPMSLRAEPLKGDITQQAAMYGPLVLAAGLGSDGLTTAMQYDVDTGGTRVAPGGRAQDLPTIEIALKPGEHAEAAGWVEKGAGLTFQTAGQSAPTSLVPLNQVLGQRYGVYWKIQQAALGPRG